MKNKNSAAFAAQSAVIAAMYIALTYFLQPISFSGGQFRLSEALTLLPVLTPAAVPGLTIGCLISNFSSPYGIIDIVLGTAATLLSSILVRKTKNIRFKNLPLLSAVFPVIFNAVCVGASITIMNPTGNTLVLFLTTAGSIALSESAVCFLLGVPLCRAIEKTNILNIKDR